MCDKLCENLSMTGQSEDSAQRDGTGQPESTGQPERPNAAPGRREASKQAVRSALLSAARQLFAEQGFEGTTVRDIAKAANVTERTFYRYFDGKEGLVGDDYEVWVRTLHDAVVARPAAESPTTAVQRAMISVSEQIADGGGPLSVWLYRDGSPARLRRYTPRPMLQLEGAIADAILIRTGGVSDDDATSDRALRARVVSRVCVAALRSAMIEYRGLRNSGDTSADPIRLLSRAFEIIRAECN
jgi:AcrR family transcriptional regulator